MLCPLLEHSLNILQVKSWNQALISSCTRILGKAKYRGRDDLGKMNLIYLHDLLSLYIHVHLTNTNNFNKFNKLTNRRKTTHFLYYILTGIHQNFRRSFLLIKIHIQIVLKKIANKTNQWSQQSNARFLLLPSRWFKQDTNNPNAQ